LAKRPLAEVGQDLGYDCQLNRISCANACASVFHIPWKKIVNATEEIASSHQTLSQRIEEDVEKPLRTFAATNREMQGISTIQGNLVSMAKELDEAQERSEKLQKKGGKASAAKVDRATTQLQGAEQQWNSQAPFIFETLQALDETRLNHLRDVLTQYTTHQGDLMSRNTAAVEQTLNSLLEIDTSQEIKNWSQAGVAGTPITERRARQLSTAESTTMSPTASNMPPPTPRSNYGDNQSQHSAKPEKGMSYIEISSFVYSIWNGKSTVLRF
jgi:F-BAR domain only protein